MRIGVLEAGGTKMVCAVGDENGQILERVSIATGKPAKKIPNGRLNSTAREETFRLNKTACHSGSVSIIT